MMRVDIVKILSTFFGVGYLPFCPGTWASLVGLGIFFLLRNYFVAYLCLTVAIVIIGFLVCDKAQERFGQKDASFIVIDEIAAILVLLIFVPRNLVLLIVAFLAFRALDILKPYPIKKIEKIPGSWGIMGDDLAACFYTAAFVKLVNIFLLSGGNSG
ncbi:phosphatidylglycerophosphatase A [Candidatus Omnitrophota bacterium]